VEDLDLSYRAQMKGWKCLFLEDIVVDAELPVQMNAAKRQQFRWAKGGVQVAMKLTSDIIMHRKVPIEAKAQAFLQLTRHIVHPLFLIQFLVIPMLLAVDYTLYTTSWAPILAVAMYIMMGPGGYLLVINRTWKHKWRGKARQFFFLMFFSSGLSVNNTVAVFDAVVGKKNEFLRTPKFGIINKGDDWRGKEYVLPFTKTTLLEIFFAIYGCIGVFIAIVSRNPVVAPTLMIPTIGFIYIAYLSIVHSTFRKKRHAGQRKVVTDKVAGRKRLVSPRTVLVGVIAFLIMGAGFAYYGYLSTMYPVNEAIGFMARAETAQTPEQLAEYIRLTEKLIPGQGNPVWLFPTLRTDFNLIHNELDNILVRAAATSTLPPHGEAYNTAMRDMHETTNGIEADLTEALPYMYVSLVNIVIGALWIAAIIGIFAAMRKVRTKHTQQQYKTIG